MRWPWGQKDEDVEAERRRKRERKRVKGDDLSRHLSLKHSVLEERSGIAIDRCKQHVSDLVESTVSKENVSRSAKLALPFVGNFATTLAVHVIVLKGCQVVSASLLRISCASPVRSTVVGGSAVALASVTSGSVSRALQQKQPPKRGRGEERLVSSRLWDAVAKTTTSTDILLDAVLGLVCFSALGGRVRSVLPSDVRYPGANANASMPAVGAAYATKSQRTELLRMLRLHGCHHCGKKSGPVVADHMPPNHFVEKMKRETGLSSLLTRLRWNGRITQRFYPQCRGCSQKQAVAVKKNRKSLVLHLGTWQPHFFAGPFVAFRTYDHKNHENILNNLDAQRRSLFRSIERFRKGS